MKRITVKLEGKAEKYFHEVAYSLDTPDGELATHSEIINHCLTELAMFEDKMGESISDYFSDEIVKLEPNSGQQDRFQVKDNE